ncbi:MAG: preprotein translocase subunit SecE [candidate division KSB1 bacterium]|nr:preprotein translocase subunit SecE [candidate division KSB1 bacterium]MDZ7301390.1 preprotein translocase subunit SecE [candidate division KSB1 bacterium]MDZ7310725.1 preprotein translocase subunit SecE [candidate division KSB1 bacterium]
MALIDKPRQFIRDVRVEMSKVSWPTREELKGSTGVVIVFSLLFALFTFVSDRTLSALVKLLLMTQ